MRAGLLGEALDLAAVERDAIDVPLEHTLAGAAEVHLPALLVDSDDSRDHPVPIRELANLAALAVVEVEVVEAGGLARAQDLAGLQEARVVIEVDPRLLPLVDQHPAGPRVEIEGDELQPLLVAGEDLGHQAAVRRPPGAREIDVVLL